MKKCKHIPTFVPPVHAYTCVCVHARVLGDEQVSKSTECTTQENAHTPCRDIQNLLRGAESEEGTRPKVPGISASALSSVQNILLLITMIHSHHFDLTSEPSSRFHIMHILLSATIPSAKERGKQERKGDDTGCGTS